MSWLIWISIVIAVLMGFQMNGNQGPPTDEARIVYFCYSHRGSSTYEIYSYEVAADEETGEMTVWYDLCCGNETYTLPAGGELMQELLAIYDAHSLWKWDGFSGTDSMILDGSGFSLHVRFADGTGISASGSNCYPTGYSEAADAIDELFLRYLKEQGVDPGGGYG